jgi:cytochrome c oxidase subunit 2
MKRIREWGPIVAAWVAVSILLEILISILPIPSPTGSTEGSIEHDTIYGLLRVAAPVLALVWVVLVSSLLSSRQADPDADEYASTPTGFTRTSVVWLVVTSALVISLAAWGVVRLNLLDQPPTASGAGVASVVRKTVPLNVQVIAQQWYWAFRYPSYDGMESGELYVPVDTPIHFHITSLDVVHSFWIYDEGVKMDAVPGVSNAAWMEANTTSSYSSNGANWVKCNELCGAGHTFMRTGLYVVSPSAFRAWAQKQVAAEKASGLLQAMPPYRAVYYLPPHTLWPPPPSPADVALLTTKPVDTNKVVMAHSSTRTCPTNLDCYSPPVVRVHLGQVVVWTNTDNDLHDAVAQNGSFDTGVLSQGGQGIWVPTKPGVYHYFCTIHLYMRGEVIVTK